MGYVLARPLKDWLMSFLEALAQALPYWVGAFALIWIIFNSPDKSLLQAGMFWVGLTLIIMAFGVRLFLILKPGDAPLGHDLKIPTTNLMIGLGLALYAESLLVFLLALCAGMAWLAGHYQNDMAANRGDQMESGKAGYVAQSALIGLGMMALMLGIHQVKGLIPLQ